VISRAPIGIFDSGVGGLSVAREIRRHLPAEALLYAADTAYCPYGDRSLEEIRERSRVMVGELVRRGAKAVVVACNTASGAALALLRESYPVPIIGLEPAVKPAAQATRTGHVGVLATEATLRTERFERLLDRFAEGVEVHAQGCPGLADLVEEGKTGGAEVRRALRSFLDPLKEAKVDVVVLGCTHYPFLREAIAAELGPAVEIIDSGSAVARQVERVLADREALAGEGEGEVRVLTTGEAAEVAPVVGRIWGSPLPVEEI